PPTANHTLSLHDAHPIYQPGHQRRTIAQGKGPAGRFAIGIHSDCATTAAEALEPAKAGWRFQSRVAEDLESGGCRIRGGPEWKRSAEHTSELQSLRHLVC